MTLVSFQKFPTFKNFNFTVIKPNYGKMKILEIRNNWNPVYKKFEGLKKNFLRVPPRKRFLAEIWLIKKIFCLYLLKNTFLGFFDAFSQNIGGNCWNLKFEKWLNLLYMPYSSQKSFSWQDPYPLPLPMLILQLSLRILRRLLCRLSLSPFRLQLSSLRLQRLHILQLRVPQLLTLLRQLLSLLKPFSRNRTDSFLLHTSRPAQFIANIRAIHSRIVLVTAIATITKLIIDSIRWNEISLVTTVRAVEKGVSARWSARFVASVWAIAVVVVQLAVQNRSRTVQTTESVWGRRLVQVQAWKKGISNFYSKFSK